MSDNVNQENSGEKKVREGCRINGKGVIAPGDYYEIRVRGKADFNGDITCHSFRASADIEGEGRIVVEEEFSCAGNLAQMGDLTASDIHVNGSARVGGTISSTGSCHIVGTLVCRNIRGRDVKLNGPISVGGDVRSTTAAISGAGFIGGTLSGNEIQITDSDDNLPAYESTDPDDPTGRLVFSTVSGGNVLINRKVKVRPRTTGPATFVYADTIEGENIDLDGVQAELVSGRDVHIRSNCEISRVEHTGALLIDEGAVVYAEARVYRS